MATRSPEKSRWRPARRSSFARRESNLALIGALLSGVIIAFALLMLLVQQVNPEQGQRIRGAGADLLRPIHAIVSAPFRLLGSGWDIVSDYWMAGRRVAELERELADTRHQAARAAMLAADVRRLEALMAARRPERRVVATAAVSASPASAISRSAILAAGSSHGVRPRMPVIAGDGLVGRVTDTGLLAARLTLLTDPSSRVPVTVARSGWTGLVVGTGGSLLEFHFDRASGDDHLQVGDRLITSGDGGLYPPNIAVGTIVDAALNPPLVRPAVNPAGIRMAMVEAPWLPPPRLISAPPAPDEAGGAVSASVPVSAQP